MTPRSGPKGWVLRRSHPGVVWLVEHGLKLLERFLMPEFDDAAERWMEQMLSVDASDLAEDVHLRQVEAVKRSRHDSE